MTGNPLPIRRQLLAAWHLCVGQEPLDVLLRNLPRRRANGLRLSRVEPALGTWMGRTPYLVRGFVLSDALIRHLPKQAFIGPGEECHLDHELRPYPMNSRQIQR